jgi:drug/metabolite transporter (DMT)-like permease
VLLRRLPGRRQRAGLAVGVLGLVLLGLPSLDAGGSNATGVGLVLLACWSYGWAVNLNVPLTQKYGALPVFWRGQLVSAALLVPFGMYGWSGGRSSWDTSSALAMLALGALGTALAFVAMCELAARVGSTRASSLTYIEAIVALAVGVTIAGEPLVALEVAGCAVLLCGAWLVSRADEH